MFFFSVVLRDNLVIANKNIKINSKALAIALNPTPKLIGPVRGVRIPEQLDAAGVAGVAAAVQSPKGKGKLKKKINSDKPPRKGSKMVVEVEPVIKSLEVPATVKTMKES